MSSPLSNLDLAVLAWVADDYGAVHTIATRVSEDAGRDVAHAELHAALLALKERGLVESYRFDAGSSSYAACEVAPGDPIERFWWLATPAGSRILESEPEGP